MKNILLLGLTLLMFEATAQDALRQKHFLIKKNVAVYGYDPVSYFSGKPSKGTDAYVYVQEGIKYRFASMTNLDAFKKNPAQYEPAYGGWCAYAMGAKGQKVEVDPENYKIVGGHLYLFYKGFLSNTLDDWNEDEKNLKTKADKNWQATYK